MWSLVPTVLLKDGTRPRSDTASATTISAATTPGSAADAVSGGPTATSPVDQATAVPDEAAAEAGAVSDPTTVDSSAETLAAAEGPPVTPPADDDVAAPDAAAAEPSSSRDAITPILARLTSCVSRDLCDELAVNFCYSNSKGARKKLVRALVEVPRGNLQLLPYYARVAATITQAYPEVGAGNEYVLGCQKCNGCRKSSCCLSTVRHD